MKKIFIIFFVLTAINIYSTAPTINATPTMNMKSTPTITPTMTIPTPTPIIKEHVGAIYIKFKNIYKPYFVFEVTKKVDFNISGINNSEYSEAIIDVWGDADDFNDTCLKVKEYYSYYEMYKEITDFSDFDYVKIKGKGK